MTYALLLWPYANARYGAAVRTPAIAELEMILASVGILEKCEYRELSGVGVLAFSTRNAFLAETEVRRILTHSLAYWFGVLQEDGSFLPLSGVNPARIGADLPFVQKYKGKTNERFTQQLINLALHSSAFKGEERLQLLDPMCGRGTTLFQALNRGWNATGLDVDKKAIHDLLDYYEKYLQYHRLKHEKKQMSATVKGHKAVPFRTVNCENTVLRVGEADAAIAGAAVGRESQHLIVCDLPYGVQHAPGGEGGARQSFEALLFRTIPSWRDALKTGGAVAVAYNVNTLKTENVRSIMEKCALKPMRGGIYDRLEHWVEQAVTRDVTVAVKVDSVI